jgi:hypothetical protein
VRPGVGSISSVRVTGQELDLQRSSGCKISFGRRLKGRQVDVAVEQDLAQLVNRYKDAFNANDAAGRRSIGNPIR